MKKTVQAANNQNLIDLAIELTGSVEGVFDLIDESDSLTSVDDVLVPGQEVNVDQSNVIKPEVTGYFERLGVRINTGELEETEWVEVFAKSFGVSFSLAAYPMMKR